ncbi:pyridoxamine 5'-phosphate oxidase family protein [Streptomyces dangxiongensis]|uniref:hypothetical protein n=1 Tax=Streptomyces dangxiongensis TaxID=1442032 RepID=UPI001F09EC7E|nr:hypothetical protein [Streptomyces dangxiongensis]
MPAPLGEDLSLTQTWVDTDGECILINGVESRQRTRNTARDPRGAVAVVIEPGRIGGPRG